MADEWELDGPKLLDIGGEGERVRELKVGLVGGHVDVVTHDDSDTASVEVQEVVGRPLKVRWDGSMLQISHVKVEGSDIWSTIKGLGGGKSQVRARVSVSLPAGASADINTVSAGAVVSGVRGTCKLNTVSGDVAADRLDGRIEVNGVSGTFDGRDLQGRLDVNTVSGAMTVHHSRVDPVSLNGVSGDITLDLTDAQSRIDSNTVSGDVTVRVPANGGYRVKVSTMSGAAIVDGSRLGGKSKGRFWGKGGGEAVDGDEALRLTASSVSGDVVLLRAGDAPERPRLAEES